MYFTFLTAVKFYSHGLMFKRTNQKVQNIQLKPRALMATSLSEWVSSLLMKTVLFKLIKLFTLSMSTVKLVA